MTEKRGCCKTSSHPKGDICGNPALQGGGRSPRKSIRPEDGPRLEDAASLDGGSSTSSVLQTGFLIMLASSPALKSGVTIDDTFQVFCLIFPSRQKQDKRFCNSPFRFSYNSIKANELGFICNVIEPSSSAVGKICV